MFDKLIDLDRHKIKNTGCAFKFEVEVKIVKRKSIRKAPNL